MDWTLVWDFLVVSEARIIPIARRVLLSWRSS